MESDSEHPRPPIVAVLDVSGRIVWVNDAWERFGASNGLDEEYRAVGENYLAVTRAADSQYAAQVAEGLSGLLDGKLASFTTVYPCHAPDRERWFQLEATVGGRDGESHCTVVHRRLPVRSERTNGDVAATADPPQEGTTSRLAGASGATRDDRATEPEPGRCLLTYELRPEETASESILAGFAALGFDPMAQETVLGDWIDTDALDRLDRSADSFHFSFPVWGYTLRFTPEELRIHALEPGP